MRKNIHNCAVSPNRKEVVAINLPATVIGQVFHRVGIKVFLGALSFHWKRNNILPPQENKPNGITEFLIFSRSLKGPGSLELESWKVPNCDAGVLSAL